MKISEQFQHEQYAEEQFERTANGLTEETFDEWKRRKEAVSKFFKERQEFKDRRAAMIDNSMFGNPYNHS